MINILLNLSIKKRYYRPHKKMMKVYISQTGEISEVGLIKEEELSDEDEHIGKNLMEEDSKDFIGKEERIQLIIEEKSHDV